VYLLIQLVVEGLQKSLWMYLSGLHDHTRGSVVVVIHWMKCCLFQQLWSM